MPSILVVDDEPAVATMLQAVLQRDGHEVTVSHGGEDAFRIFREHGCFDLVIADIMMPGMTGPRLMEEIIKACPKAKAIFITGYSDETVAERLGGCPDLVFRKPFPIPALVEAVRRCLAHRVPDHP